MYSIVDFYGKQSNNSCGYCKRHVSQSHGMWAHSMTCRDYQDLIDRGWRRSGCYCYKPEMNSTCCPSYTIKCDATQFRLNRSHKKIIKKVNRFLKDGHREDGDAEKPNTSGGNSADEFTGGGDLEMGEVARNPRKQISVPAEIETLKRKDVAFEGQTTDAVDGLCLAKGADTSGSAPATPNQRPSGNGSSETSLPKKAKLMRIERKKEKLLQKGLSAEEVEQRMRAAKGKNVEKTLEDLLDEAPKAGEAAAHRLEVKLVPSSEGASSISFALYCAYQTRIHQDPPEKMKKDRFQRFLVKSPLKYSKGSQTPSCGFGSFHQQYWLDDRLIAVGVIDILPSSVSSVYFFYDPEYRFLALGTYGSLREVAFTRKLYQQTPSISNYYMGFYIHSCPKMRYKANLTPSYLLCPEVYSWHPITANMLAKLDRNKYCRLNEDSDARDANRVTRSDLANVLILHGSTYMRYSAYQESTDQTEVDENVSLYARLVGKVCSGRMLLYEG
ncbi:arginyl-tRNA--protein transferase 1 isoform X2 [Uranotaenia lowii]|uniref:arginyl-tRNA--protein transferase 1 isoform X2 n=1 Tax=Uranotaenia lowii TaxID=190385 RepID=UPI00247A4530|nr:arginyl-tRNA--protein transferase 1 isoform X2 [Uranotaenia lowii]